MSKKKDKETTPYTVTMTVTNNQGVSIPLPDVINLKWWQRTPKGYYRRKMICNQCEKEWIAAIRKGVQIFVACDYKPCPNCGC